MGYQGRIELVPDLSDTLSKENNDAKFCFHFNNCPQGLLGPLSDTSESVMQGLREKYLSLKPFFDKDVLLSSQK